MVRFPITPCCDATADAQQSAFRGHIDSIVTGISIGKIGVYAKHIGLSFTGEYQAARARLPIPKLLPNSPGKRGRLIQIMPVGTAGIVYCE
jgi:hypothetical protein